MLSDHHLTQPERLPDSSTSKAFPDKSINEIIGATAGDDVQDALVPSLDSGTLNSNYLGHNLISNVASPSPASEDSFEADDLAQMALTEDLSKLSVTTIENRFFGRSR